MAIWPEAPSLSGSILISLLDVILKATIVLTLAALATRVLKRSSAAVRHRIWALAMSLLVALPALSILAPGWRIPVWADRAEPLIQQPTSPFQPDPHTIEPPQQTNPEPKSVPSPLGVTPKSVPSPFGVVWRRPWGDLVVLVWGFGFLVVIAPTLAALVGNHGRRLRSRRVDEPAWLDTLDSIARRYAIRRRVDLRFGDGSPVPMTWGIARPLILIPNDAQTWPEPTRRVVLLHELAHVARCDVGWQLVGRFAAALSWFHPLAWVALRQMRVECEHACDDRVLSAGVPPEDYAAQLLNLARSFRASRFTLGLAMARATTLEGRMTALFDENRSHSPLPRSSAHKIGVVAAGLFLALGLVHPGPSVAKPEQAPASQPVAITAPAPAIAIALSAQAKGRIEGRVVLDSDGSAVAGAKVVIPFPRPQGQSGNLGRTDYHQQVTDANGAFAFDGLSPGEHRIWAYREALSSRTRMADWVRVEVTETGVEPKPVELRLKPGLTWKVRVKERATGKPISGATAHIRGYLDDAITDAEGVALVCPLTAEGYIVQVWAVGFAKVDRTVDLTDGGDTEADVFLDPGGNIEGVVRDSTGRPLAQVMVRVSSPRLPFVIASAQTDKTGRYQIEHLPVDQSLDISLVQQDFKSVKQVIQLKPTEQTFDFTLEPRTDGGSVAGVVVDSEGHPIGGANVSNRGDNPGDLLETTTGPDGRFVLQNLFNTERPEGKVIRVQAKLMAPELIKVTPGPADKPSEIKVTLSQGHRIKGRVLDDKNQPLSDVRVTFSDATRRFGVDETNRQLNNAEGLFRFDTLPATSLFNFSKRGYPHYSNRQLLLDGEATVDVVLNPAGQITGRVLDASTGQPITRFNVTATFSRRRLAGDPSGSLSIYLTDSGKSFVSTEGEFQLKELIQGMPFQVTILVPGFEEAIADRVVAVAPDSPRVEEFRLTRLDPTNLENYAGRLLDPAGKPVVGADVVLIASRKLAPGEPPLENAPIDWNVIRQWPRNRHPLVTRLLTAVTDGQGRFSFGQVPKNGEVELAWWGSAVAPGRQQGLEKLNLADKSNVEIQGFPPSRIEVTVDRGKYPTAAQVSFIRQDGDAYDYMNRPTPTPSGFEIGQLPAGTYLISLRPAQRPDPNRSNAYLSTEPLASRKVTVGPGETARVEFND